MVEYAGIRLEPHRLTVVNDGRAGEEIAIGPTDRVVVSFGPRARWPMLQTGLGGTILVADLLMVARIVMWLLFGGTLVVEFIVALVVSVPLGVWLVYDAWYPDWRVRLLRADGSMVRQIPFASGTDESGLDGFLASARAVLGDRIDVSR